MFLCVCIRKYIYSIVFADLSTSVLLAQNLVSRDRLCERSVAVWCGVCMCFERSLQITLVPSFIVRTYR